MQKKVASRINFSFGLHERFGKMAPAPLSLARLQSKMVGSNSKIEGNAGAPEAIHMELG